jgi:hypothetical protein
LLLYTVVVASAPFQSFAHAVCSKQHRRQQQWAAPCAHKAQSIFSCWSWAEDGAVCQEHIKFFGETSKNFEGTLKCTSKFFGETFFHFFHSSDFLHSILLIGEFQIFVVEYLNIWTYLNYSNFPVPPQFKRFLAIDRRIMKKRFFSKKDDYFKKKISKIDFYILFICLLLESLQAISWFWHICTIIEFLPWLTAHNIWSWIGTLQRQTPWFHLIFHWTCHT